MLVASIRSEVEAASASEAEDNTAADVVEDFRLMALKWRHAVDAGGLDTEPTAAEPAAPTAPQEATAEATEEAIFEVEVHAPADVAEPETAAPVEETPQEEPATPDAAAEAPVTEEAAVAAEPSEEASVEEVEAETGGAEADAEGEEEKA